MYTKEKNRNKITKIYFEVIDTPGKRCTRATIQGNYWPLAAAGHPHLTAPGHKPTQEKLTSQVKTRRVKKTVTENRGRFCYATFQRLVF